MASSSVTAYDSDKFLLIVYQERFHVLPDCLFTEERSFNSGNNDYPKITRVLKKHKLTFQNCQIQHVAKGLVLEFYANVYRINKPTEGLELFSWLWGKELPFDWKYVNWVPKEKFKEPNCQYHLRLILVGHIRKCWIY